MASIRQKSGSPYWYACLTLPNRRTERSTKLRIGDGVAARRKAQALADTWERDLLGPRALQNAHRVVRELFTEIHGKESIITAKKFLAQWLAAREGEVAAATHEMYYYKIATFTSHHGETLMTHITPAMIIAWRQEEAAEVTPTTVNTAVGVLKIAFASAVEQGVIDTNPFSGLKPLKKTNSIRRGFTIDELNRVLALASAEWRSMILFGFYTGARLQDISRLTWSNIDLPRQELHFVAKKTARRMVIPIHPALMEHISEMPAPPNPEAPLHPKAMDTVERLGRVGSLSSRFRDLLVSAELARPRLRKADPARRQRRRAPCELSYHSLRHTATSMLKDAGVSGPVAQELIGHNSAAINQIYTHLDPETLRAANATLPALGEDGG